MTTGKDDAPTNASEWLTEAANDKLTPAQKAALADWLRESPTNVRELLRLTLIQKDLGQLKLPAAQIEAWVADAKSAAHQPPTISPLSAPLDKTRLADDRNNRIVFRANGRRKWRWASVTAFAATILVGAFVYRWQDGRYATGVGEQRIVTLPDGSVVEIDTDSTLKLHYSEHRRAINLIKGQAFFRVAHDQTRPFVVSAGGADVKAVGTQFNVRIVSDATLVSVVEGTVEVRDGTVGAQAGGSSLIQQPAIRVSTGQEARITPVRAADSASRLAIAKITPSTPGRAASWTRGRVEFENTPLGDVLSEFQRYQDVNVTFDDNAIRQLKLTGSFDAHDPESALAYIATLPNIAVERVDAHTYRIRRRDSERP